MRRRRSDSEGGDMRPGKQRSRTPASFYHPSPRPCPERLPPLEYPGRYEVRRVSRNGGIRWKKGWVNISPSIIEQNVGLEEIDDGVWSLYFGSVLLGRFHENDLTLHGSSTHLRARRTAYGRLRKSLRDYAQSPTGLLLLLLLLCAGERRTHQEPEDLLTTPLCRPCSRSIL